MWSEGALAEILEFSWNQLHWKDADVVAGERYFGDWSRSRVEGAGGGCSEYPCGRSLAGERGGQKKMGGGTDSHTDPMFFCLLSLQKTSRRKGRCSSKIDTRELWGGTLARFSVFISVMSCNSCVGVEVWRFCLSGVCCPQTAAPRLSKLYSPCLVLAGRPALSSLDQHIIQV